MAKATAKCCSVNWCEPMQEASSTATKIPPKNFKWPSRREYNLADCFPPDHIEEYVHKSLRNADLESFDLMQLHTWEDKWLDDDRWAQAMSDLRSQGLFSRHRDQP
ncbi:MAG: hypothetical protein WKF84_08160 [Pyrinomonadaceae bacterium]